MTWCFVLHALLDQLAEFVHRTKDLLSSSLAVVRVMSAATIYPDQLHSFLDLELLGFPLPVDIVISLVL